MRIFVAREWEGEPKESEEMAPKWYHQEKLPYGSLWVDDRRWLPKILAGKKIDGAFHC